MSTCTLQKDNALGKLGKMSICEVDMTAETCRELLFWATCIMTSIIEVPAKFRSW